MFLNTVYVAFQYHITSVTKGRWNELTDAVLYITEVMGIQIRR